MWRLQDKNATVLSSLVDDRLQDLSAAWAETETDHEAFKRIKGKPPVKSGGWGKPLGLVVIIILVVFLKLSDSRGGTRNLMMQLKTHKIQQIILQTAASFKVDSGVAPLKYYSWRQLIQIFSKLTDGSSVFFFSTKTCNKIHKMPAIQTEAWCSPANIIQMFSSPWQKHKKILDCSPVLKASLAQWQLFGIVAKCCTRWIYGAIFCPSQSPVMPCTLSPPTVNFYKAKK